jgi:hypothetical protein
MRVLFVSGAGILPDQRIHRWRMVSQLYGELGKSFRAMGHHTYYYVHPEAWDDTLPPALTWLHPDHEHFGFVLEKFSPDFVFCWNGSSPGDLITATMAGAYNAKMVFSEQGWFPQSTTLYFDMTGTNARCSIRYGTFPAVDDKTRTRFVASRRAYMEAMGVTSLFDVDSFRILPPDLAKPAFVPLQDERDLNIKQDAPFRTMDEFLGYLVKKWPGVQLRVRPHPKYPNPKLSDYPSVTMDNPKKPMFQSLSECGVVIGINSTTLLESALLGKTVVSFGESLATGTGLLHDARPGDEVDLSSIVIDNDRAERTLNRLLAKQLPRDKLGAPGDVLKSDLFNEMRKFVHKVSPLMP